MGRDSTGNYTSPSGQFSANTTISSSVVNGKFNDIGTEITDSLSRNGYGGMLAPLRGQDGTINLPAYAFTAETTLGVRRHAAGDMRVSKDGTDIFKFNTTENRSYNALKVSAGGLTVDAGGLTVTAGGLTITAGGTASTGSAPAQGGVAGANTLEATGSLSGTSGHSHAITTAAKFSAGGNVGRLNLRTENRTTVVDWHEVRAGLSYDIDSVVGSGGSAYFSFTEGLRITGGTTATGAAPANAAELTNGNLKLSGTAPNKDQSLSNTVTPANIVKAWGIFTTNGSGAVTVTDGFNITSATITAGNLSVTLGEDMASTDYLAIPQVIGSALNAASPITRNTGSTVFDVMFFNAGAFSDVDLSSNAIVVQVMWLGRQA